MIRKLIQKSVNRLGKHTNYTLDQTLNNHDIGRIIINLIHRSIRGFFLQKRFKRSKGLVMVGRGSRILHPGFLEVGKNFIVGDFSEIFALSKTGIIVGDNVTIGSYVSIKPSSYYGTNLGEGLIIGDNSNIGSYSYVGCSGLITIGNNVLISPRVSFFAENHNFEDFSRPIKTQGVTRKPITILDDCWIASGSIVLAGVTIGRSSIVAAGSVVTSDVPPFVIVAGSPAKVIRYRDKELD